MIQKDCKQDKDAWFVKRKLKENGQRETLLLTEDNIISLKNHKIALTEQGCSEADFAILSKKKQRCHTSTVLHPSKRVNYEIFIAQDILVQQENSDIQQRLWFNQGGQ